jgi:hypothetical protein
MSVSSSFFESCGRLKIIAARPSHRPAPFSLEQRECVQRSDDLSSFGIIYIELDYTLADGVLRCFDAAGKRNGVSFQYSGFVEFHPFVLVIHGPLLTNGPGTGKQERLVSDVNAAFNESERFIA